MILTDLSNTTKKLWEKISFHKHFKRWSRLYKKSIDPACTLTKKHSDFRLETILNI